MVRFTSITVGIGLAVLAATAANSQAMPTGPVPGSGDATKISSGNRDANAEYNYLIGAGDPKPVVDSENRSSHTTAAVPATASDIKVGSALRDVRGTRIGAISQLDDDGVVVDTGTTKIKVPASAVGKDNQGLLLGITAGRFNKLVAKAQAGH